MSRYTYDSKANVWVAKICCYGHSIRTQGNSRNESKNALRSAIKSLRAIRRKQRLS